MQRAYVSLRRATAGGSHDSCSIRHRCPAHICANDLNVIVDIDIDVDGEEGAADRDAGDDLGGDRAVEVAHGSFQGYRRAGTVRQRGPDPVHSQVGAIAL